MQFDGAANVVCCIVCKKDLSDGTGGECGRCRTAIYCSKSCQVHDWKQGGHKQECNNKHSTAAAVAPSNTGEPTIYYIRISGGHRHDYDILHHTDSIDDIADAIRASVEALCETDTNQETNNDALSFGDRNVASGNYRQYNADNNAADGATGGAAKGAIYVRIIQHRAQADHHDGFVDRTDDIQYPTNSNSSPNPEDGAPEENDFVHVRNDEEDSNPYNPYRAMSAIIEDFIASQHDDVSDTTMTNTDYNK